MNRKWFCSNDMLFVYGNTALFTEENKIEILEVTVENFDEKVLNSEKPVMLDFWATWCGPCQMQAPIFHTLAEKNADTAVFGKVNVDEQMELAREFEVASIPTILVIKNGEVAYRAVGLQTEDELQKALA